VTDTPFEPTADQAVAEEVARRAGELLLDLRRRGDLTGSALRDAGDAASHRAILDMLAGFRPDDAVLSEEGADDPARLDAARVWIVDPLDGTREYAESGDDGPRSDWAVHVALWTAEGGLTAGAVAIPARGVVHGAGANAAARIRTSFADAPIRLAVSRSHPAPVVSWLADAAEIEAVPMGSAGVKAMAVVDGDVDGYVHDGGQYEWDSAAPVAVAAAAGLVTHRLDGSALEYNRRNPWLPDLLVATPATAARLRPLLDRYAAEAAGGPGTSERKGER